MKPAVNEKFYPLSRICSETLSISQVFFPTIFFKITKTKNLKLTKTNDSTVADFKREIKNFVTSGSNPTDAY